MQKADLLVKPECHACGHSFPQRPRGLGWWPRTPFSPGATLVLGIGPSLSSVSSRSVLPRSLAQQYPVGLRLVLLPGALRLGPHTAAVSPPSPGPEGSCPPYREGCLLGGGLPLRPEVLSLSNPGVSPVLCSCLRQLRVVGALTGLSEVDRSDQC